MFSDVYIDFEIFRMYNKIVIYRKTYPSTEGACMNFAKKACFFFTMLVFLTSCDNIRNSWKTIEASTAYNQGNYDKAIEIYKELIERNPNKADLYWSLGIAYYSKGEKLLVQKQIVQLRKLNRFDLAKDLEQLLVK